MSARTKHLKNILRLVVLLLVVSGIAFAVEYSQALDGAEVSGRIVEKHRKSRGGGPTGDGYDIVIEYPAHEQIRRFTTSRAVWDMWGALNTVGASVPVLYLEDGRAFVNRFSYLYPFTTILLCLTAIGAATFLVLLVIPRSRLDTAYSRIRQYQQAKNNPHPRLSPSRRFLLGRLNRLLLMFGGAIGLVAIGAFRSSAWLLIAGFAGVILLSLAVGRILVCPHCGASLARDLKEIVPRITYGTNWLMVRDYLAKGVPLTCRSCGRSLDD